MNTVSCVLNGGEVLQFQVCTFEGNWQKAAGLYVFAHQSQNGWVTHYAGQTIDFSERISNHERWDEAVKRGATHVLARLVPLAANRDRLEKLLIQTFAPPMNVQHRVAAALS